ncbi:hypothetical protein M3Y97_00224200 [Aphelenchoides bicaudatus]|nr:hypothetical protein M3Y97_00224200 [Aphelenchoides bicaudatus]
MPESELMRKIQERAQSDQTQKIQLPRNFISWEYGSNKHASQKGSGGFNRIRNTMMNIESSRDWIDCYEVPFHLCPTLKRHDLASQAGQSSFGKFRDNLIYVKEHNDEEKKTVNEMLVDPKATSRILPRWNKPNNEAKNDQIGSKRQTITEAVDKNSRRLTREEKQKCLGAVPRFQNIAETMAARHDELNGKQQMAVGLHSNRKIITNVNGLDRTEQDQLDSNRYMAWIGGQLTLQSQSKTAGFMKKRDVVNVSYYDKLIDEAAKRLEMEQLRERDRQEKDDVEQNFSIDSTEATIPLPKENKVEYSEDSEDEECEDEEE